MSFPITQGRGQSEPEAPTRQLSSANSRFGFRLLKELAKSKNAGNVFLSPYSISSVLQMVSTGARGRTQQELQQVLGTSSLSAADLNTAYKELNRFIQAQTNVTLNIANALWYRAGSQLEPQFVEINQEFFGATLSAADFADPASVRAMNNWAAQSTHGKIQTIVTPPIPADTAMVLANAIYFKGLWLHPFDPKQTRDRPFHVLNGSEQTVPMMQQTRSFRYQETDGLQAIQLPYAGDELTMEILLPATNSSPQQLIGQLDSGLWEKTIVPGFRERRGTLQLPRFGLRYGAELKAPLSELGLKSALSQNADFSGISRNRLFLSAVEHQSFVEVNEQGTEAAAVTTGVMALASVHVEAPPFTMIVDRPFLLAISHLKTRSVLFVGVVTEPGPASN